jgi:hypothetical protein
MSDDDNDWAEKKKEWEAKLESGQPLMAVMIDHPMKVFKGEEGSLVIDTATFGLAGFDRLGTLRVTITPAATDNLKWVFANLETIPEGLVSGNKKPSTN